MVSSQYAIVPGAAITDARINDAASRVFTYLALRASKAEGWRSWPGVETIAEALHRSVKSVRRALHDLIKHGWLVKEKRGKRDQWVVERVAKSDPLSGQICPVNDDCTSSSEQTKEQTPAEAAPETPLDRPFQEPDLGVQDAKMTANRRTPPPDQPALLPTEAEAPKPTAQHLVAAWVDGYRQTFGEEPQPAMMKRVAGQCGRLGKTCETVEHWRRAWRACRVAGTKNRPDAVPFLAADNPPSLYSTRQGVGTMVRSLAQRRADLLAEQQAQIEQVTR